MSTELNYIPNDYIYDIECYPNVFTLATSSSDGKVVRVWEVSDRMNQTQEILSYLRHLAKKKWRQVGFNNLGFDYPVLHAIMEQAKEAKRQGNQAIDVTDTQLPANGSVGKISFESRENSYGTFAKLRNVLVTEILKHNTDSRSR